MKIITLLPVKNESWILSHTLPRMLQFSDQVILLDDGSTDTGMQMAREFEKVTIIPFESKGGHINMSDRRNALLASGRKTGGTHFVFLDADESFSANVRIRELASEMKPGQKMLLPWVNAWKEVNGFFHSADDETNYKDFVFCDDNTSTFENKFLSEGRTPGENTPFNGIRVPFSVGYVLHFQKLASVRNQIKQAWYRCNELIEGSRSARRINATYNHTIDNIGKHGTRIGEADSFGLDKIVGPDGKEYLSDILSFFDRKSSLFFEGLDIWHIKELKDAFESQNNKPPVPQRFPSWILRANVLKNKLKMLYCNIKQKINHA